MTVDPGQLDSWRPLSAVSIGFVSIVAALAFTGRRTGERSWLRWVPRGLERATGIPGWAAGMVGTASFALLVAGIGFYNDVAWHVGVGRDEELFTPPHTMIVLGLALLVAAGLIGILFATLDRRPEGFRWGPLHVPRSAASMTLIGGMAMLGFPADELWHHQFGIDVTMWSPTHLLMIVGASITPIASWLALAEAGVKPRDSWRTRAVYMLVSLMLLDGLSSVQGEFDFGVPQFQALYAPVLVAFAGALALVAIRLAHGPGWSLLVAVLFALTRTNLGGDTGAIDLDVRSSALYLGSAACVEIVAWFLGTRRPVRLALGAGAAIGTAGLATEWWWNQGAHQPWSSALLPDAIVLGVAVAAGAALLGVVLGAAARGERTPMSGRTLAVAGLVVVVALAWPLPRRSGDVTVQVTLDRATPGEAYVEAELTPADAAADALWFQASAWQGGGLVAVDMESVGVGAWRSEGPVPIAAPWKTLLRLHRGAEMMAVPIFLPADAEIEGPRGEEFPAVDKTAAFEPERRYLLREQTDGGSPVFGWGIPGLVALLGAIAVGSFGWIVRGLRAGPPTGTAVTTPKEPVPVG